MSNTKTATMLRTNVIEYNIFNQARKITVTPISLKDENGSKANFQKEQDYQADGYSPMWTDAPENVSQIGDLFAFIKGAGTKKSSPCKVHIHKITAILPNNCSRPDWAPTCNDHKATQTQRNVLVLSPQLVETDWEIFADLSGKAAYITKKIGDPNDPSRMPVQRTVSWYIK